MKIVLVHGWSVFDTSSYGELPQRLEAESQAGRLPNVTVQTIWLGKYISFRDEVRVSDLAKGFEAAIRREVLADNSQERFACITHSTGGPVVREWWWRLYRDTKLACPMSHLIMLAPANFGSALAQLGKGRLSRLRSWNSGVEPGQGVLDWLEHGSREAWELNRDWIRGSSQASPAEDNTAPVYPFVLTGQTIDRKLYDHLNSYTGESGSDGTIRVAAANLNAKYVKLEQHVCAAEVQAFDLAAKNAKDANQRLDIDSLHLAQNLKVTEEHDAAPTAFRLIEGASHTGSNDGILYSIKRNPTQRDATVAAILRCLNVRDNVEYLRLSREFAAENVKVRDRERLEISGAWLSRQVFFHDAHSLAIVRFRDDEGHVLTDLDFKLTGKQDRADGLPPGFMVDRQKNLVDRSTLTLYFNHDVLKGLKAVADRNGKVYRDDLPGIDHMGIQVVAYPNQGFVRFFPAILKAARKVVDDLLLPDQTTMIEIVLKRIVHQGVFELPRFDSLAAGVTDFRKQPIGPAIDGT
jgi:hypothetical protein